MANLQKIRKHSHELQEEIRKNERNQQELERLVVRYLKGEIDIPTFRKCIGNTNTRFNLRVAGVKLKKPVT